jgi:beta-glucosidase
VGQEPLYYNHRNTGRPEQQNGMVFWSHYTDVANTPLFPFGFGLSYTSFEFSDLELSTGKISGDERLQVTVTVKNTGQRAGAEVAQLYVRDLVGSVTRPVLELKGFERIELEPGAVQRVVFSIGAEDLAFYTAARRWEAEPGVFEVSVGNSSVDRLSARFTLE